MGRPLLGKYPRRNNPLYGVWRAMHNRCYNPKNNAYSRYGGRGVLVEDTWHDFDCFYEWAIANGWEQGLQIDKDIRSTELGLTIPIYSSKTCMFVTNRVNAHNSTSLTFTDDFVEKVLLRYLEAEDTFEHRKTLEKEFGLVGRQLGCILARRVGMHLGRGKAGVLTEKMKQIILEKREEGFPFKKVAEFAGVNYNTCKAWHAKYMRGDYIEL